MTTLPITVRQSALTDIVPIGELALASLTQAPSSAFEIDEVPGSPLILGEELAARSDERLRPIVAELGGALAGFVAFERRSMARSHHVIEVRLLIHPDARGRGIGRQLLVEAVDQLRSNPSVQKLVMIVASDDRALLGLLDQCADWTREQRCRAAWARGAERVDVESWANTTVGA